MKYNSGFKAIAASALLAATVVGTNVTANQISYSSTSSSDIVFDGANHFDFTPSSASFEITSGTANTLTGEMGGSFTIGPVSTFAGISTAAVTGSGTFTINDGANLFTATLTWVNIFQNGTGGNLNTIGTVNLTSISYSGSNPDLVALEQAGAGIDALSFTFTPAVALSTLATSGVSHETSFAGTINSVVPDGGTTVALMGGALLVVGGIRRKLSR